MHGALASDRQAGFTIVEMTVVSVLLVAVISFTFGSITAIKAVNEYGENRLEQSRTGRDVLDVLRREFARSSLEPDKITNEKRFSTGLDADGNTVVSFRVLIGASIATGEIEASWSPAYTIRLDAKKKQLLLHDGKHARVLGSGILSFQAGTTLDKRIRVVCEVESRDPNTGRRERSTRRITVRPLL